MKIYGDIVSAQLAKMPGVIYGHNDVLTRERESLRRATYDGLTGSTTDGMIFTPSKLYLHISNTPWSFFTGMLREYCLPWRWKGAYLDPEDGTGPQRILVCPSVDGELFGILNQVIGQSSVFVINLIKGERYEEHYGREYLKIPRQGSTHNIEIIHPLGEWAGSVTKFNRPFDLCHIHRIRGVFSSLKYHFLKTFSSEWEEVFMQAGQVSENVLIKKNDRAAISRVGLIFTAPETHV